VAPTRLIVFPFPTYFPLQSLGSLDEMFFFSVGGRLFFRRNDFAHISPLVLFFLFLHFLVVSKKFTNKSQIFSPDHCFVPPSLSPPLPLLSPSFRIRRRFSFLYLHTVNSVLFPHVLAFMGLFPLFLFSLRWFFFSSFPIMGSQQFKSSPCPMDECFCHHAKPHLGGDHFPVAR